MRRIRIEANRTRSSTPRRDRYPALPLDARDPAILRAKQLAREADRTPRAAVA
jgi:hypothetical protein